VPVCSNLAVRPAKAEVAACEGQVLVIQLARLGDFLQTTPLLRLLKEHHPGAKLNVLVTPAQAPLARACPDVDGVWDLDLQDILPLPDLNGFSPQERQARWRALGRRLDGLDPRDVYNLNLGGAGALLCQKWPQARMHAWRLKADGKGLTGEPWAWFVMNLVSDRRLTRLHLTDILASYAQPQGPPPDGLIYQVEEDDRRRAAQLLPGKEGPVVALQLGANSHLRRWPVEYFAALAAGLIQEGAWPVLVGSQKERPLGRRLGDLLGPLAHRVTDLMGRTDLPTLAGVLASAQLLVSGDTGTLHLATAVNTPVLALFMGPAVAHETGPYGAGHLVLQARDECGPCQEHSPACRGRATCRRLITSRAALQASLGLLAGQDAKAVGAGLDLISGVEALLGARDGFGQRYLSLKPRPLNLGEGLALALREAGRVLMRSAYAPEETQLAAELGQEYAPPDPWDRTGLAELAHAGGELARAADQRDAQSARHIIDRAPAWRFLGALAGEAQPLSLPAACRAAARVLALAADGPGLD